MLIFSLIIKILKIQKDLHEDEDIYSHLQTFNVIHIRRKKDREGLFDATPNFHKFQNGCQSAILNLSILQIIWMATLIYSPPLILIS